VLSGAKWLNTTVDKQQNTYCGVSLRVLITQTASNIDECFHQETERLQTKLTDTVLSKRSCSQTQSVTDANRLYRRPTRYTMFRALFDKRS